MEEELRVQSAELKVIEGGYREQSTSTLTELLEMAQRGEITEFIAMYKGKDGVWHHKWTGSDDLFRLIGAIELLKERQIGRTRG